MLVQSCWQFNTYGIVLSKHFPFSAYTTRILSQFPMIAMYKNINFLNLAKTVLVQLSHKFNATCSGFHRVKNSAIFLRITGVIAAILAYFSLIIFAVNQHTNLGIIFSVSVTVLYCKSG